MYVEENQLYVKDVTHSMWFLLLNSSGRHCITLMKRFSRMYQQHFRSTRDQGERMFSLMFLRYIDRAAAELKTSKLCLQRTVTRPEKSRREHLPLLHDAEAIKKRKFSGSKHLASVQPQLKQL